MALQTQIAAMKHSKQGTERATADSGRRAHTKERPHSLETRTEQVLTGESIGVGVAIGPAFVVREDPAPDLRERLSSLDRDEEEGRFRDAVIRSISQLGKLQARLALLPEDSQFEIGSLLDVYRRMLGPSRLQRGVIRRIAEGLSAEVAVFEETEALAQASHPPQGARAGSGEDAAAARRRADEFREIGRRLLRNLTRTPFLTLRGMPDGAILVTESLRPSDAALIDPSRVAAVVSEEGGATGHTAIMLRALGIPAVLAVAGALDAVAGGAQVVVDGDRGRIVVDPAHDTLVEARGAVATYAQDRQKLGRMRRLSSKLASGEKVLLQANLELPAELPLIAQSGAAGIGLLRTEFLFINSEELPDETTQFELYASLVEAMGADTTTIRVLDWGGEKPSEALERAGLSTLGETPNPALGLRGIRLLLKHPALLETQLAAILRASAVGPLQVLLPMVTVAEEITAARDIYERVARRLRRKGVALAETLPPFGAMIETPAAALTAGVLAHHADFLAIGTNDLTMYALAADRASADVASLYDARHPAVLRMIADVVNAALQHRTPVSLCGEIAGDPALAPLLVGLGLRSLSMTASAVPRVKQVIRSVRYEECVRLGRRVLAETDSRAIMKVLQEFGNAEVG